MYLSVIIPAYNEEKRIEKTLLSVGEYLSRQDYDYEILVVNDGSKDNTAAVTSNLYGVISNLKLINNEINRGKGWVVKRGMVEARGNYRLFMDADNATTIDHVDRFWPYVHPHTKRAQAAEPQELGGARSGVGAKEGYDVVIASIAIKGAEVAHTEPFYKRILGKLGNLWIQCWVLPGIWDSQRGFKLFSAKAAQDIFPKLKITRWGFDIEALALARKFGYKIREVPIKWVNDPESKVKPSAYFQVWLETLKIRWWLWTGKYRI